MAGGGPGKSAESVARTLSQISETLKLTEKLMDSIGKKAAKLDDVSKAAAGINKGVTGGGSLTGTKISGGNFPTGVGAANFGDLTPASKGDKRKGLGLGSFSDLAVASGYKGELPGHLNMNPNATGGGGLVGRLGAKSTGAGIAGAIGAGALSGAWNALPSLDESAKQRQAMFTATLGSGSGAYDYKAMKDRMMTAFGGYASTTDAQERTASFMQTHGFDVNHGDQTAANRFMGEVSGLSRLTGKDETQVAAEKYQLGSSQSANALLRMGISQRDSKGKVRDETQLVNDIIRRTYGGKNVSRGQIARGLEADGNLRDAFRFAGIDEETGAKIAMETAGKGNTLDIKETERRGLTDIQRNPQAREAKTTGEHSKTVSDYSGDMLKGWEKALQAAEAVEKAMQSAHSVLAPVAGAKGFGQGLGTTHGGSALLTGLETTAQGLGMVAAGRWVSGKLGGKAAMGFLGDKLGGGAAAVGRGAVSRLAGAGGAALSSEAAAGAAGAAGSAVAAAAAPVAAGITAAAVASKPLGNARMEAMNRAATGNVDANSSWFTRAKNAAGHFDAVARSNSQWGFFGGTERGLQGLLSEGVNYGTSESIRRDIGGMGGHNTTPAPVGSSYVGGQGALAPGSGTPGKQDSATKNTATGAVGGGKAGAAIAKAYAEAAHGTRNWYRRCDMFVAYCYGLGASGYSTAAEHSRKIPKEMHHMDRNPPAGATLFWGGGAGHVALAVGGGKAASNDVRRSGKIDIVPLEELFKWMGNHNYEGWTPPYYGGKALESNLGPAGASGTVDEPTSPTATNSSNSPAAYTGSSAAGSSSGIMADENGSIHGEDYSIASRVASSILGNLRGRYTGGGAQKKADSAKTDTTKTGSGQTLGAADPKVSPGSGTGVDRWKPVVLAALKKTGLPTSDDYISAWLRQITTESSGNPNAVQSSAVNDINVQRGDPARGLVQVPGVTWTDFGKDMGPFMDNWKDPYKNLVVGMRAAKAQHPNQPYNYVGQGHGYSEGSYAISKDQEANIHMGEMIVPAGMATEVRKAVAEVVSGQGTSGSKFSSTSGGSGEKKITINLVANGDLGYDSRQLADAVERILNERQELSMIGAN